MKRKFMPQVSKNHYFKKEYNTKKRWISYWHQINEVLNTKPKKVLEVGVGNGITSDCLKKFGIKVVTADIDKSLNPDVVCSVTELSKYFAKNEFDTVLCAEVLEHIPFKYFEKALREMYTVSRSYVIITLPYSAIRVRFSIKLPLLKEINFLMNIPFPREHKFDGEHYWEIGKKGYSLRKITKIISKFFIIERKYQVFENPYHMFFILKKR